MTIQEAIRSGKPFKLPLMQDYIRTAVIFGTEMFVWCHSGEPLRIFPVETVLSENWSILEDPKNLIRGDFSKKRIKSIPKEPA